jgi:hypothetical protein
MQQFRKLLGAIDVWVGPIYRVIFVLFILFSIASSIVYFLIPYAIGAYNWFDQHIANIGPALIESPTSRLAVSVIAGLLVLVAQLVEKLASIQRRRISIIEELRRCQTSHLRYYDELYTLITDDSATLAAKAQLISKLSRDHSVFLCSRLAEIFELITGSPCHASVKTFDRLSNQVTTRTRDALMHNRDRTLSDEHLQSYPFESNTAFAEILTDHRCAIYHSNHLRWRAFWGAYKNANPRWKEFYSATSVMPISSHWNSQELNPETVIGFLCIDNRYGKFGTPYCRAILGIFVVFFNDMMLKLGQMDLPQGASNG